MNAEQKQHFINEAKKTTPEYKEKDYVFLGYGSREVNTYFNGYIGMEGVGHYDFSFAGMNELCLYLTSKTKWESVMGISFESIFEEKVLNYEEMQKEQIEAFSLIGKTIYHENGYSSGKVHSAFPIFREIDFLKLPGSKSALSDFTKKSLKEKGFVIILFLSDIKGNMSEYVSFNNPCYSLKKPITVETTDDRNYTGKPDFNEKVWNFGCAKVSFETISKLSEIKSVSCCKSIQNVEIGRGIFPMETIKEMAKIQENK